MSSSKFGKRRPKYTPPKVCKKSPRGPTWTGRGAGSHPDNSQLIVALRTPAGTGATLPEMNWLVTLLQQPNPQQYAGRVYAWPGGRIEMTVGFFNPPPGCVIQINCTFGLGLQNWRQIGVPTDFSDRVCVKRTTIDYLAPLPASPPCSVEIYN